MLHFSLSTSTSVPPRGWWTSHFARHAVGRHPALAGAQAGAVLQTDGHLTLLDLLRGEVPLVLIRQLHPDRRTIVAVLLSLAVIRGKGFTNIKVSAT